MTSCVIEDLDLKLWRVQQPLQKKKKKKVREKLSDIFPFSINIVQNILFLQRTGTFQREECQSQNLIHHVFAQQCLKVLKDLRGFERNNSARWQKQCHYLLVAGHTQLPQHTGADNSRQVRVKRFYKPCTARYVPLIKHTKI